MRQRPGLIARTGEPGLTPGAVIGFAAVGLLLWLKLAALAHLVLGVFWG